MISWSPLVFTVLQWKLNLSIEFWREDTNTFGKQREERINGCTCCYQHMSRKYQGSILAALMKNKCFVNASPFLIILILFNMLYFSKVKKIELSDWCRAITINSQAYHLLLSIVLNSVTVKVPLGFKI